MFTLPIVAIFAGVLIFALKPGSSGDSGTPQQNDTSKPLPALTGVAAPPHGTQLATPCAKLVSELPVTLAGLAPRAVHPTPDSPFVVAWGDPAIVLRCGVDRPAKLAPGSSELLTGVNGVFFLPDQGKNSTTFTVIDREPYVEVVVPKQYEGGPLSPIADAVTKALPAVCKVDATAPTKDLCTHRP